MTDRRGMPIMYGCQRCQERLLDHLYDLLDDGERADLLAHMESCPPCRQALAAARDQRRLLAAAAKRSFPEVVFGSSPATETSVPPRPTVVPRAASGHSLRRTYALAALAAVLLLSLGLGQFWFLRGRQQAQGEQLAQLLGAARDRLARQEAAQREEVESLDRGLRREMEEIQTRADSEHLRLVVTGPRHLPPGATAEYTVKTFDRQGKPLDALVMVEVDRAAPASGPLGFKRKDGTGDPGKSEGVGSGSGGIPGHRGGAEGAPSGPLGPTPPGAIPPPTLPAPKDTFPPSAMPGGGPGFLGGPSGVFPKGDGSLGGSLERGPARPSVPAAPPGPSGGRDPLAMGRSQTGPAPGPSGPGGTPERPRGESKDGPGERDETARRSKEVRREALPLRRTAPGTYTLTVPPDVVPEGRELAMSVRARPVDARQDREELAVQGKVTLSAPVYRTYLTTDRPVYRPGETVRFRSLTLDRATHTPLPDEVTLQCSLVSPGGEQRPVGSATTRPLDEKGKPVLGPDGRPVRGITAGQFVLPDDAGAGAYTLQLRGASEGIGEANRTFLVREARNPQYAIDLEFHRDGYGAGDEVLANVRAHSSRGVPHPEALLTARLTVDGTALTPAQTRTDASGRAQVRFTLPRTIVRGRADLAVTLTDKGAAETVTRPVPLAPDRVEMEFFPEGGDLVVGLPSRVYFTARSPLGRPTEIRGTLMENGRPTDVHLSTLSDSERPGVRQGMGVFAFTPKPEALYTVRIDSPRNIAARPALPAPRPEGVTLRVEGGVFAAGDPIRVQIHTDRPRELLVGAFGPDALLDSQIVPEGQTDVVLRPTGAQSRAGGVCRITVFESLAPRGGGGNAMGGQRALAPLAERLVFRRPAAALDVRLQTDQKSYRPADRVRVRLDCRDDAGAAVPGLAQVAVVDERMLTIVGDRTQPTMPAYFLLTSEIRRAEDLEHADFLLGSHPKAPAVLDLVLGTQGWRRFAGRGGEGKGDSGRERGGVDEERFLNLLGERTSHELSTLRQRSREVADRYLDRGLALLETLQRQREERLAAWREAQAEASERAEGQFARWKTLRDVSALTAGLLAVVLMLVGLAVRTRGPWLLLSFALGATALILMSLVPLAPQDTDGALAEPEPTWEKTEAGLSEFLAGLREGERSSLPALSDPGTTDRGSVTGGSPPADGRPGGHRDGEETERTQDAVLRTEAWRLTRERLARELAPQFEKQARGTPGSQSDLAKPGALPDRNAKEAEGSAVREYAHVRPEYLKPGGTGDHAETVYWHPVLVLPEGGASFSFQLPDHPTRFGVTAHVHTLDGRLATATATVETRPPATDKRK